MRLQPLRSVRGVAVRELYRRKTQWRGIRRMFTNWAPTTRRYRHRSDVSPFYCPSVRIYIYICHHLLLLLLHLDNVHCSFSQMSGFPPQTYVFSTRLLLSNLDFTRNLFKFSIITVKNIIVWKLLRTHEHLTQSFR